MKHCAFLTTDNLDGFVTDDELAVPALAAHGWCVDDVPWRAAARWEDYDLVIVRSPWDYQKHPAEFDAALQRIVDAGTRLCNSLPLMRWNMEKTYLRELEARGVPMVPTVWSHSAPARAVRDWFDELGTDEIVIKPVVSANADHAYRLRRDVAAAVLDGVERVYDGRACLVQPFLANVLSEGEYSLIYFSGILSHTILKTPKPGDFRVQEEHGGLIRPTAPSPGLLASADAALRALDTVPLYARADFVRTGDDEFAIMELELIEPALYFRMDAGSPARFAAAVEQLSTRLDAA